MKMTPKSCSCNACRRGKSSKAGKLMMKKEERSFRHQAKISIKKGKEELTVAPYGNYTD